jgi:hypothetical protein
VPPQPEWIKWRTCTRKVKYAAKPANTDRMASYKCPFCDGWHRTTRRKPLKINRPVRRQTVVRGGFEIER